MGIVRNLVVCFKNWYKDRVNNVVNNMNVRELTDDVKLRDNSKGKRPLAGLVAFVLLVTPVLGLTENSEVELTNDTRISAELPEEEKQMTVEEVIQNITAIKKDYEPKIVNYEMIDLLQLLDNGFIKFIPTYLILNGDYDNVELLSRLITSDKAYATEEDLFDYWYNAAILLNIQLFNSMRDLKEGDELDIGEFIRDENRREDFREYWDYLDNYVRNFKNDRATATQYLKSFMKKVEEKIENLDNDKSDIRYLYLIVHLGTITIQSTTCTSSDFVPLIVSGSSMSDLKPADGIPFDWHDRDDDGNKKKDKNADNKAILGVNNDLYKKKKVLERKLNKEDAKLHRDMNSLIKKILAASDDVVEEQKSSVNGK